MGKGAPSPPPAPSPAATAAAQTASNVETAQTQGVINHPNQITPYGSSWWSQPYGTDQWMNITELAPSQQTMLDQANQAGIKYGQLGLMSLGQAADAMQKSLPIGSAPPAPNALPVSSINPYPQWNTPEVRFTNNTVSPTIMQTGSVPDYVQRAADATSGQVGMDARNAAQAALMARLNPTLQNDTARLDTQLRNQGLVPGSDAYNKAMEVLGQNQNDARLGVIAQAGQEQALQSQIANTAFQAQNQRFNDLLNLKNSGFQQQLQAAAYGLNQNQQNFGQDLAQKNFWQSQAGQNFSQQLQAAQYGNSTQAQNFSQQQALRNQFIQEALLQRQTPLNETAALLSGQQIQYPQFGATPQTTVQPTDVIGATGLAQQQNQANYNAQVQANSAANQGLFGLGSSLAGGWALAGFPFF